MEISCIGALPQKPESIFHRLLHNSLRDLMRTHFMLKENLCRKMPQRENVGNWQEQALDY